MWPLRDLQWAFREATVSGDMAVAATIAGDGLTAEQRIQIYRNHHRSSLIEALAANFPVTERLLGRQCFASAAAAFVGRFSPRTPCLREYRSDFPIFLSRVPVLEGLPYLADVGRLEWAMNLARNAPDVGELWLEALEKVPSHRVPWLAFRLHPASHLVASRFPVDRIWRVNQPDADTGSYVDLSEGGVTLLVHRDADLDVVWRRLDAAEFAFLRLLRAGRPLSEAHRKAAAIQTDFDLARVLTRLIETGVFCDFACSPPTATSRDES